MHHRIMSALRVPSLVLAALIQIFPGVRVALPAGPAVVNLYAIIFRWGAGAAAALGGMQAVSGASTAITTPLNQRATNGVSLGANQIRLITAPDQAHYWQASGLPLGLYLSGTSGSTSWKILGTPTVDGVFNVGLTAKDTSNSPPSRTVTATMVITVVPGGGSSNSPPVASAQNVTATEDTAKSITLTGSDPNGNPLTYAIVTGPAHGTLSGTAPNLSYAPAANFNGADSFTFKVNDGIVDSAPATVSITINAVNDAPTANAQSVTTTEDTAKVVTLTGSDIEGNALTYTIISPPTKGTLSGTGANRTFTPAANLNGADTFTFKVNDGIVDSAPATVSITINAINDAPTATAQSISTTKNTSKALTLTGTDVEGGALTYAVVMAPAHGTLSGSPPSVIYAPAANYAGPDSFTFKVNDGLLDSPAATISITVLQSNVAPVAIDQPVTATEDTPKAVLLAATDVDGDALTYSVLTPPAKGMLSGTAPNLTYMPAANMNGADSFTFKVNDGTVDSAPATVSISITGINDAPVAHDQSVITTKNIAVEISLAGTDVEGSALAFMIINGPAHGTLRGTPPSLTFTPALDYFGSDSFTFKVHDGALDSSPATVTISIKPGNTAPAALNDAITAWSGVPITIAPLTNDFDVDGDALALTIVSPTNGTASISAGTNITFMAASNFTGMAYVAYTVSDGKGGSASAIITIAVAAPPADDFAIQAQSPILNPFTGLFEQLVAVTNTSSATMAAVRVLISGLRAGATLYNSAGLDGGRPYVQHDTPLNPGQSVSLLLRFYVPDRQPFTDTIEALAVLPDRATPTLDDALAIDRSYLDHNNGGPKFVIEFPSTPGREYTIIYSEDAVHWKVATPSITASTNRVQWSDSGPPTTVSNPMDATARFYQVIAAPAP